MYENKNIVLTKSHSFAVRIVKMYQHLSSEKEEYVLNKQVLLIIYYALLIEESWRTATRNPIEALRYE